MKLISVVWDHNEWESGAQAVLRNRLRTLVKEREPWEGGCGRGCAECGQIGFRQPDVLPKCHCWQSGSAEDYFVLWYHSLEIGFAWNHLSAWSGYPKLLAVVLLSVRGKHLTLEWKPSLAGTDSRFFALSLRTPLSGLENGVLGGAIHALGGALTDTTRDGTSLNSKSLDSFRRSSALLGNKRAAKLWNAEAPDPVETFAWSVLKRQGKEAAAKRAESVWNDTSREMQELPLDLVTLYEGKAHSGLVSAEEINQLVADWFHQNRVIALALDVTDVLWNEEYKRVEKTLQELNLSRVGKESPSDEPVG